MDFPDARPLCCQTKIEPGEEGDECGHGIAVHWSEPTFSSCRVTGCPCAQWTQRTGAKPMADVQVLFPKGYDQQLLKTAFLRHLIGVELDGDPQFEWVPVSR